MLLATAAAPTGFVIVSSSVDCSTAGCAAAGALVVIAFTLALLALGCAIPADVNGFELPGAAAAAATGVEDDAAAGFEDDALAEAEAAGAPAPPAADVF